MNLFIVKLFVSISSHALLSFSFDRLRSECPELVHLLAVLLDRVRLVRVFLVNIVRVLPINICFILWVKNMGGSLCIARGGNMVVARKNVREGVFHFQLSVESPGGVASWTKGARFVLMPSHRRLIVVFPII